MIKPSSPSILIIDDTPENIDVLRGMLAEKYRVRVATDGATALDSLRSGMELPSLILLDIMMPGLDGYQVCRELKADPRTKEIPVIFVTALSNAEDEIKGFQCGAADYIRKPFSVPIVCARIQTHLSLRQLEGALEESSLVISANEELASRRQADISGGDLWRNKCLFCSFWQDQTAVTDGERVFWAECRRFPRACNPAAGSSSSMEVVWVYPKQSQEDWCGEFVPRQEES